MDFSYQFKLNTPDTVANVFVDDAVSSRLEQRFGLDRLPNSKPVTPEIADMLQRSRDRMQSTDGRQALSKAAPQIDPRAASARGRLQGILQRAAQYSSASQPQTEAAPEETPQPAPHPTCKRTLTERNLRHVLCESETRRGILDRLLSHRNATPFKAHGHRPSQHHI